MAVAPQTPTNLQQAQESQDDRRGNAMICKPNGNAPYYVGSSGCAPGDTPLVQGLSESEAWNQLNGMTTSGGATKPGGEPTALQTQATTQANAGPWKPQSDADMPMNPAGLNDVLGRNNDPNVNDNIRDMAQRARINKAIEAGLFPELQTGFGGHYDETNPETSRTAPGSIGVPVGVNGDPFAGTWGENFLNQGAYTQIASGQMTPEMIVRLALQSQGVSPNQRSDAGFLDDLATVFPQLYAMGNPGKMPDPEDLAMATGQSVLDMSNSTMKDGYTINTRGLWDNMFSDPAIQSMQTITASPNSKEGQDPRFTEYQSVQAGVSALAPFIGQDNATYLGALVDQAWQEFQGLQATTGVPGNVDFLTYLRDVKGADDWF